MRKMSCSVYDQKDVISGLFMTGQCISKKARYLAVDYYDKSGFRAKWFHLVSLLKGKCQR